MDTQRTSLLNNSRFYILATSVLVSVALVAWLRILIPADQLFYIRTQQVYGFISIFSWYFALIISPLGYAIGTHRIKHIEYARRAIGVSAFYFALLHIGIAIWGQLGGIGQLHYLPDLFRWSLIGGGIAILILGVMAATSFDTIVRRMTFKRWKLLHRLVYAGGVVAMLHVWSVGTHLAYTNIQIAAFVALLLLSGLELFRMTNVLDTKYLHLDRAERMSLFVASWSIVGVMIFTIPMFVQNYHSRHTDHSGQHGGMMQ